LYRLKVFRSITAIPREDWNRLTGTDPPQRKNEPPRAETIPFLEWEWLAAMEESGSAAPETGWHPLHLTLWKGDRLAAAAPFYLKTHSQGEFVYDYFWAEAAAALGRPWYPKLVGTVPATPAEGYRFLCAGEMEREETTAMLLNAAETICRKNRIPAVHILFADPRWAASLPGKGYTPWEHSHYLWENPGYADFGDYLSIFSKNQRKNIRREYQRSKEQDIRIRIIPGEDAEAELFGRMFELFSITNDKFIPWDARYVNRDFFLHLERHYRRRIVFVEARGKAETAGESGELAALAMLIRKGDRIWGRYWGAYEEIRDLHFALCYYAPMDWAIREGIRFFDPGAGSPHKIRRGFRAVIDRSWHRFFDPVLERLFKDNIGEVNRYEREALAALNAELPFKNAKLTPGG
jgi:predicted N-acyltransferase